MPFLASGVLLFDAAERVLLVHQDDGYVRRTTRPRVGFLFLGRLPSGAEPEIADPEIDDMRWFRWNALPKPLAPGLDRVIDDARAGLIGGWRTTDDS